MEPGAIPEWTGDVAPLRELQLELATRVRLKDDFAKPLRTVAGFDVGFEDDGETTRAAAVLLDADTLQLLESRVVRVPRACPTSPAC